MNNPLKKIAVRLFTKRRLRRQFMEERLRNQILFNEQKAEMLELQQRIIKERSDFQSDAIGLLETQLRLVEKVSGKTLWNTIEEFNLTLKDSVVKDGIHVKNE